MYQKLILIGHVGGEPMLNYLTSGQAVAHFSLATNRRWTDRATGEKRSETTWFRVSVWGTLAETIHQYVDKGTGVMVEGRLQPDPATGGPKLFARQDGSVGAAYELRGETVRFLGGDGGGDNKSSAEIA